MNNFLMLFISVFLLACSGIKDKKSYTENTKSIRAEDIDTGYNCGIIVRDTNQIKKLMLQFSIGKSLSRDTGESELISSILGTIDLEGFVKKISQDTIFCVGTGIEFKPNGKKNLKNKNDCIIQQEYIKVISKKSKTIIVTLFFEKKVKEIEMIYNEMPSKVIVFSN